MEWHASHPLLRAARYAARLHRSIATSMLSNPGLETRARRCPGEHVIAAARRGAAAAASACQHRQQAVDLDRLDEVRVEPGEGRLGDVVGAAVAGEGDQAHRLAGPAGPGLPR